MKLDKETQQWLRFEKLLLEKIQNIEFMLKLNNIDKEIVKKIV